MNAVNLDKMDPISPVADASEERKEVIAPQSGEPLVTDELDGRVADRRSGWMKAALVLAALIAAGAVAYSTIIGRPHSNGIFAVETGPLAVADAKDAKANALASAASARKSALAAATSAQKTVLPAATPPEQQSRPKTASTLAPR